jgi:carotenoid cleavage dioxygenase
VRIGPNPVTAPDPASYHWFRGTGMVHGLRIRDGRVEWYRNRWVRSGSVARALDEPLRRGPVHASFDASPNTNVISHGGRTLALVEAGPRPYELTDELDTVGPCDFDGTLPGGYSAHPKVDPRTGELHAIGYFWGWPGHVQYTVVGADGRVRQAVDVPVGGSPMMHDFALTERFVVLLDLPVTLSQQQAAGFVPRPLRGLVNRLANVRPPAPVAAWINRRAGSSGSFPYTWNPDHPARVGLMSRADPSSPVRWFEIDPCYVFHVLNAYDDGPHVVVDCIRHPRMFDRELHGPDEGAPTLDRWTIDLDTGRVHESRLDDHAQEFPRIDDRLAGSKHRFGYTIGSSGPPTDKANSVLRHDLLTGGTDLRALGPRQPSEMTVIGGGDEASDDDDLLMGFVYDPDDDRSSLVMLHAASLATVAEVQLPARVPHGFHGNWLGARQQAD